MDATDFTKGEFKMIFKGKYHIATASSILEDDQVPVFPGVNLNCLHQINFCGLGNDLSLAQCQVLN